MVRRSVIINILITTNHRYCQYFNRRKYQPIISIDTIDEQMVKQVVILYPRFGDVIAIP